ncbi:hypothetical protein SAMD00019534_008340, partial [Acytostelium subglobosum LB1]|uniref:hypothetical protein n=1 Tax=Acytostelium subglobosum LB1 TaxID=1410327 RepID=UPI0006449406
ATGNTRSGGVRPAQKKLRGNDAPRKSFIPFTSSEIVNKQKEMRKMKPREPLAPIDPERIMATSYMVTEESTKNEKEFEDKIKQLMIEQQTEELTKVKIPQELIDGLDFRKRYSPEVIRFADYFFAHQSKLVTMAIKAADFPTNPLPQIAFVGRSNVGKSTLLNTLLGDQLARVSKTPGCTKSINFYSLWEKIMLVDLPGYGFSKVSKEKASVWGRSISEYLLTSHHLLKVFLLIDGKVGCQKNDLEVMKLLDEHRVAFQIILTKIDKATPTGLKRIYKTVKAEIMENLSCMPNIVQCSSLEQRGIQQVRALILEVTQLDKDSFNKTKELAQLQPKVEHMPHVQRQIDELKTRPLRRR